jgi:hypothetical protein
VVSALLPKMGMERSERPTVPRTSLRLQCRRHRWLGSLYFWIPGIEGGAEVIMEHLHPHLEQSMRAVLRPPHLLLLHHPLAHHLIDRRLGKPGRNALAVAIALTIVGNPVPIACNIVVGLPQPLRQFCACRSVTSAVSTCSRKAAYESCCRAASTSAGICAGRLVRLSC